MVPSLREDDGASTVAWLEAPVPTERSHVQLEVDEEPPVPDEPSAAVPFAAGMPTLAAGDSMVEKLPGWQMNICRSLGAWDIG